ncbi:MAG TPA: nucleotidyltransferase domain-containing protein, partial [Ktedonobacterales bacterium]|nr:nucleotidyltransferase domain-containing protein [Ktedonobacterales bacterium]
TLALVSAHRMDFYALGVRVLELFGSFVRDEQRGDSDLDFVAEFAPSTLTFRSYMQAKERLESLFHRPVDLALRSDLKPRLWMNIQNEVRYVPGLSPLS